MADKNLGLLVRMLATERMGPDGASDLLRDLGDDDALFAAYRALANVREPMPAPDVLLATQDLVLAGRLERVGVTRAEDLPRTPRDLRFSLWRGDITTLEVDAIVNAANSRMLGCWVPGHSCIDNAIHTYAGIQLRLACADLMRGRPEGEPTGEARLTPAFNLPSGHVIHTVGPIVRGRVSAADRRALASCYESCLDAASAAGCRSVAFCCISTGVFGYPADQAAPLAVETVRAWLDAHPEGPVGHVVFDVFTSNDEELYRGIL